MSRSRAKGTAFESLVVDYLRRSGVIHAERRALNGAKDRGDIAGLPGVVIECKNAARVTLAEWLNEAAQEALNDGADLGVVWAKRKGRSAAEHGYIVMDPREWVQLMREAGRIPAVVDLAALQAELDEEERINPEVAAAARRYDKTVERILRRDPEVTP